MNKMQL